MVGYFFCSLGAFIVVSLIEHFLFPYLKKKGENLAIKQDIKVIELKKQSVKYDISIYTYEKISLHEDKKSALLSFSGICDISILDSISITLKEFDFSGSDVEKAVNESVDEKLQKIHISYGNLEIYFCTSDDILKKASQVVKSFGILFQNVRDSLSQVVEENYELFECYEDDKIWETIREKVGQKIESINIELVKKNIKEFKEEIGKVLTLPSPPIDSF